MSTTDPIITLHATLKRRETPETVAGIILEAMPELRRGSFADHMRRMFGLASHQRFGWSSMARSFRPPDRVDRQLAKARELALLFLGETLPDGADAHALDSVASELNRLIGKAPAETASRPIA